MVKSARVASGTGPTAVELRLEKGALRFLSLLCRCRPGHGRCRCHSFCVFAFSLFAFYFSFISLNSLRIFVLGCVVLLSQSQVIGPFSFGCSFAYFAFGFATFVSLVVFLTVKGVGLRLGVAHLGLQ